MASVTNSAIQASGGAAYSPQATVGVSIVVVSVWSLLNCFRIDQLGWINNMAAFCQMSSILFIIISLLAAPSRLSSTSFVFTHYQNETGFENTSYVILIGLLSSLFAFTGFEASAHMAEETTNASVGAPFGIISTCVATGIGGAVYLIALLCATVDIEAAIDGLTDMTTINVFLIACGDRLGAFMVSMKEAS
jgi:amino acid transporter